MNSGEEQKGPEKKSILIRGLYMLLYLIIMQFAKGIVFLLAFVQFIFAAVGKTPNRPLQEFGQGLSTYLYEMNQFLFFNSDHTPFPFAGWNNNPPGPEEPAADSTVSC